MAHRYPLSASNGRLFMDPARTLVTVSRPGTPSVTKAYRSSFSIISIGAAADGCNHLSMWLHGILDMCYCMRGIVRVGWFAKALDAECHATTNCFGQQKHRFSLSGVSCELLYTCSLIKPWEGTCRALHDPEPEVSSTGLSLRWIQPSTSIWKRHQGKARLYIRNNFHDIRFQIQWS